MDSMIPLGQKNTLAEYMILSGADNRPPMLDKDLYDSWKSRMELYMKNREHRRMILESVEHGPLIWPTIEENGVTRTKKYVELSAAKKIQADCDMKATNIILQGLPNDIYSLVNHHRVSKDLWERFQLLMHGTSLTKQERECKLYDAFDKFTHIKGESLHKYYLRFTQLINDMNMEQFQVNTKFLNSLPPEWSKFVTDVKLVKDLQTTNFDQLHAYLEQHELHANEVRLMRERNQDPLALFPPSQYGSLHPTPHYSSTYPSQPQFNHSSIPSSHPYQSQLNHQTSSVPQIVYQSSQAPIQPMTESPLVDSGLVVLVVSPGDDPIACLNKAMTFLTAVASSRFPSTNNKLRTSSNPRNQATIQDGRVTVQQVQGRQGQSYYGMSYKGNATSSGGNNANGQAKVVKCYNCQGEWHMARQCTQPKRPRNAAWYKEKAMLAEAQEAGQILDEEQLAFFANPGIPDVTAKLERYKERVKTFEQRLNFDLSRREKMIDSQMDDMIKEKLALKEQVDALEQNISKQIKEKESLLQTFTVFKNESKEKEKDPEAIKQNISHKPIDYKKLNIISEDFGKCFTPQQELSAAQAFWFRMSNPTIESSEKPPIKVKVPSELPKVSLVNASLKKLKFHLSQFDSVVKKRTTPNARTEDLLNKIMEVQTVFDQMEVVVQQSSVDKQCLKIAKKELLLENDRLLQKIMSQDVLLTVMNSMSLNAESVNVGMQRKYFENNDLKAQLQNKDTTICKLEEIIKSLREKSKVENVNHDKCENATIKVELENSVANLLSENEHLCKEINHVKRVFKEQFDSIKKTRVFVITSLKNDLRKLKGKQIVDNAAQIPSATTIVPGMFKLDLDPLAPRLLQNREAHIDYHKHTQEQADILRGIVEQAKAKQPLDNVLDISCKHAKRIQELLVYVRDTCPNAIKLSAKKVVVTPKTNVKKFKFIEPLTSSSNIKQVESSTTSDSNTPVLSSTGLKCSTSNCGSKPTGNKKNDRISQTPSRNMKNKVEAQPMKVNKKNHVVKPIRDANVTYSLLNANSKIICATCKKSMSDDFHDMCLLDFVKNVNSHAKSAKKHTK
ncbi:hypothetical protein Tco_0968227 [Tanacetum coccineum]